MILHTRPLTPRVGCPVHAGASPSTEAPVEQPVRKAARLSRPRRPPFADCLHSDYCREGFRANVGICLFNQEGLVFAGRTTPESNACWQLPQGGIRDNETPLRAAVRELREETGISTVEQIAHTPSYLCYNYKRRQRVSRFNREKHPEKYWGQCQKWFLMRFAGQEQEVKLNDEFSTWQWMPLGAVAIQIPALKHDVYAEVATCFTPIICQHTSTLEPLTRSEVLHEEAQTAFRARILATQSLARERLARAKASGGSSSTCLPSRRRLFVQPGLLASPTAAPASAPQTRRRPGRRKRKALAKAAKALAKGGKQPA